MIAVAAAIEQEVMAFVVPRQTRRPRPRSSSRSSKSACRTTPCRATSVRGAGRRGPHSETLARVGPIPEVLDREVGRAAEHGQLAADDELPDAGERERLAGPVPVPDAVVEAEHCARQEPRVALRHDALLHPAREERSPGELEVAHSRSAWRRVQPPRGETHSGSRRARVVQRRRAGGGPPAPSDRTRRRAAPRGPRSSRRSPRRSGRTAGDGPRARST